jgi:predicted transcriptional regulator
MDPEKLDLILTIIDLETRQQSLNKDLVQSKISKVEFEAYSKQLFKDGFVKAKDLDSTSFLLTEEGTAFIRNGGYLTNNPSFKYQKKKKSLSQILSILGLGISACLLSM